MNLQDNSVQTFKHTETHKRNQQIKSLYRLPRPKTPKSTQYHNIVGILQKQPKIKLIKTTSISHTKQQLCSNMVIKFKKILKCEC